MPLKCVSGRPGRRDEDAVRIVGMSDPDRRAIELRWLENERELCRLNELNDLVREFFAPCIERLEVEQERIETELAKYCVEPLTVTEALRGQPDNDDLLCVWVSRGSVYVHSADGIVIPHGRHKTRLRP